MDGLEPGQGVRLRDVMEDVDRWLAEGAPVAMAVVLATWGSAPRGVGARLAVAPGPRLAGSVSGGCVEAAVAEVGLACLADSLPRRLAFGVTDEAAWSVGLACGGRIDVFVAPVNPVVQRAVHARLAADRPVAMATVLSGPGDWVGRARVDDLDGCVVDYLPQMLTGPVAPAITARLGGAAPGVETIAAADGWVAEVFVEVFAPAPTLVMVGAGHIAQALTDLAAVLGWRTVVVDPRSAFATPERFPRADRRALGWPAEVLPALPLTAACAVAVLSHEPRLDDGALIAALSSPAFYVGALGSPVTQARRRRRLAAAGLDEAAIDRLRGPIGLDLGARSPAEIALAVLAEALAAWRGRPDAAPRGPA
jgi:xanthine dehydrogenase accessory factor